MLARWWSYIDFWLGLHKPEQMGRCPVPMFISYIQLKGKWRRSAPPRPLAPVCGDGGGFTVIDRHGCYPWSRQVYADDMARFGDRLGGMLAWCAAMDWMCEPPMLAKTGKTVLEHQQLTVESLLELRRIRPEVHWIPVLQGWHPDDYEACAQIYEAAGIALAAEPIVGLGSVCRRQGTRAIEAVVSVLRPRNLRLHGFGVKADGFDIAGADFFSADSQGGSAHARHRLPMSQHRASIDAAQIVTTRHVGTTHPVIGTYRVSELRDMRLDELEIKLCYGIAAVPVNRDGVPGWVLWIPGTRGTWWATHRNCANCLEYLLMWRRELVIPRIQAARDRARSAAIMTLPGMEAA